MNTAKSSRLVYGEDARVAEWIRQRAPHTQNGWSQYTTIGLECGGELIAGVIYTDYRGHSIQAGMASTTPRWATRTMLQAMFAYPFEQLKVKRITAYTGRSMTSVQRFLERLGFQFEGLVRQGFEDDDCVIYGMLRSECRWIERSPRYERQPEPAACA